jgi:hypothetical protein
MKKLTEKEKKIKQQLYYEKNKEKLIEYGKLYYKLNKKELTEKRHKKRQEAKLLKPIKVKKIISKEEKNAKFRFRYATEPAFREKALNSHSNYIENNREKWNNYQKAYARKRYAKEITNKSELF